MKNKQPNPRRAELRALSMQVRELVKAGMFPTVNAAILELYAAEVGRSDFASFKAWKEKGTPVKKGERGFPVWGQPRALGSSDHAAKGDAPEGDDGREFWPVAYLFHGGQVEPATLRGSQA